MNKNLLNKVTFVRPGGNDTAIIWDEIARPQQLSIAKDLLRVYKNIEQVMFVEELPSGVIRGQMAGGEFCGNATRSLGYLLLKGLQGEITFMVSGSEQPVKVSVNTNNMVKTSIPVNHSLESVKFIDNKSSIVHMEGISFYVVFEQDTNFREKINGNTSLEQKENVLKILKNYDLLNKPAAGLMIVENDKCLHPYVYVHSIDSLYYETGCGSGSAAVALVEAVKLEGCISKRELIQPSGMSLFVTINRTESVIINATVEGPIAILFEGSINLD